MAILRNISAVPERYQLDRVFYDGVRAAKPNFKLVESFLVEPFSGLGFRVAGGQSFRVVQAEGPQVGDMALWSAHDPREFFGAARTCTWEGWFLSPYKRLWSELPRFRPMATVIEDTVVVELPDPDFHHHFVGGHCCTEWNEMRSGRPGLNSCHVNFLQAIGPFGLGESDIHDNVNIFQKMRLDPNDGKKYGARSDSKAGDYIEFYAEIDLLVAVTVCPNGDNTRSWSIKGEDVVLPLRAEVYDTGIQPKEFPTWTNWRTSWTGRWAPPEG